MHIRRSAEHPVPYAPGPPAGAAGSAPAAYAWVLPILGLSSRWPPAPGAGPPGRQNGAGPLPASDISTWVASSFRTPVTATVPICS